jgi:hypothetical protein
MSQTKTSLENYTNTHLKLLEAIDGLTDDQLKYKPAPHKWSITEVLSHLADHSIVFSFRIRKVISETNVQQVAFQQDEWVQHTRANEGSAADILKLFEALITYNTLLLSRLFQADWEKSALNAKGDPVRLATSFQSFIDHVHVHILQIERIKLSLNE